MSKALTQEEFVTRSSEVHKLKYDYKFSIYENSDSRVEIVCPLHGSFMQTAHRHLAGQGCKKCAEEYRANLKRSVAASKFIDRVVSVARVLGREYNFDKAEYKHHREKVTVTCQEHGDFLCTPHNLINGKGCPLCAVNGYRTTKEGSFYVLQEPGGLTKVGITNRDAKTRAANLSSACGKKFEVVAEYRFRDGKVPNDIETQAIRFLRSIYNSPAEKFPGSSECFLNVDHSTLLPKIEQLIQEHTDAQQQ